MHPYSLELHSVEVARFLVTESESEEIIMLSYRKSIIISIVVVVIVVVINNFLPYSIA